MTSFSPDRYNVEVIEFAGAKHKAIFRRDLAADGNRMIIIPGLAKNSSELEAANHPHHIAYLDGAARGPFYDSMRGIFSLDHHHDKDCACVIFHDGKAKWTIKLSGFVDDFKLSKVSDALNASESLVKSERGITDAVMLNARWGGGEVGMSLWALHVIPMEVVHCSINSGSSKLS